MKTINITAKTLDEAITQACVELAVTSDRLEYEVIKEGTKGFFGIGARDYEIKASVRDSDRTERESKTKTERSVSGDTAKPAKKKAKESAKEYKKSDKEAKKSSKEAKAERSKSEDTAKSAKKKDKKQDKKDKKTKSEPRADKPQKERKPVELTEDPVERAETFLQDVFGCMNAKCSFTAQYVADTAELKINLSGDDVAMVIGKRGQTMDALQYLTSQVVNKHQHGYIRVKIDTENYRERRKEALESLAHSMAEKAVASQKPMVLEPMNAYERRIIHSSLKPEDGVTTRSEGEEPYRHIVICPIKK